MTANHRKIMVEKSPGEQTDNSIKLFIGNLSFKSKNEDIQKLLTPYGEILAVDIARDKISGKSKGFAFATLILSDSSAMHELDGLILHERSLRINDAEKHRKVKRNKKKKRSAL